MMHSFFHLGREGPSRGFGWGPQRSGSAPTVRGRSTTSDKRWARHPRSVLRQKAAGCNGRCQPCDIVRYGGIADPVPASGAKKSAPTNTIINAIAPDRKYPVTTAMRLMPESRAERLAAAGLHLRDGVAGARLAEVLDYRMLSTRGRSRFPPAMHPEVSTYVLGRTGDKARPARYPASI
jgi:hypothetical protein